MSCTCDSSFLAATIATLILLLLPIALPVIRRIPKFNASKTASVGGGMAMAAVFVFMLPDVISKIHGVAAETEIAFLKSESHLMFVVFSTFLFAFCIMYALEKIALDSTKINVTPNKFIFFLHMLILCSMLITLVSSFPSLANASVYALGIVCSLAIFEIFLEETALLKHFNHLYSTVGRYLVLASLVIGWIIGLKFADQQTTAFTLMFQAFVIGMILTAVIKGEFDLINQANNYRIFVIAATIKTLIILGIIFIEDNGAAKKEEAFQSEQHIQSDA